VTISWVLNKGLILFQKDIKKKVTIYEPILLGGSLFPHQFAFIIYYFSTNFVSIPYHEGKNLAWGFRTPFGVIL